ncbi:hypothetical protein F2Q68_00007189 [Brassica cretica]|uniref:Pentacotripeptide-repeat region of PRORP domain-containing protein n=1 Tax=Brassica cretica TaxID=69181 RepID=A0A8S9L4V6_BRACR|nr:hypothetical protein F2Q68_00007189 [Brassica cretica]
MSISKVLGFLILSCLLIASAMAQSPSPAPFIGGGRRIISPSPSKTPTPGSSVAPPPSLPQADSPSIDSAAGTPSSISDSPSEAPGLQPPSKTPETYTSLLHAYAASKQTERAEALFKRIIESESLTFGAITYNEMMTLYMSVGEVEKVRDVIEVMKRRNVSPDIFTYNLWLSSRAATFDIDELRKILEEMRRGGGSNEGWARYIDLTSIYINSSRLTNAESRSPVESEKSISQREWVTYDFLMILHTGLGNKGMVDQIWKSLRNTNQKLSSRSYICVVSSYLMLGCLREAGEVVDQWKESKTTEFDGSACLRILNAFRDVGLEEKASEFQLLLVEKKCSLEDEVS